MEAHEKTAVCHASLRRRPNPKHCSFACWPACSFSSSIHCPLPHQLSSVGGSVEKPLPRTSGFKVRGWPIENSTESPRDRWTGLAASFAQARVPASPIPPRAEQQSEGDGIEKGRKGINQYYWMYLFPNPNDGRSSTYIGAGSRDALASQSGHASYMVACGRLPNAEDSWHRPAISSSRLIGSARFDTVNTKCPIQKALFSSVLLLLALASSGNRGTASSNTDPLSWSFFLHGAG
ncbi:hypothetical protein M431DRAFT_499315 [Trichoderma harzianum CBS 226.95]|uniref:Uncharacterized protein n=1 Tax=Trichoderma harzianum CBS 226.95 TaxID=983964 RepID=A0A2T4A0A2_TRIHA|nr:hypothetical protein M431DRAFT_499315 [Trichoderma harzianum CBS 226.95]PTB50495.1 hypothetical protein M431DRAFT_499315 [Trichoderma harzianum CBS 226.95]